MRRVGIVGARGFVGQELLALLAEHPGFEVDFVSSRELVGQRVCDHVAGWRDASLLFDALDADGVAARGVDVVVLALPNKVSPPFVAALDASASDAAIIDLSADWRFDDAWVYGWPERLRAELAGARRIANPGCYATGMQTALWPLMDLLDGPPHCFGVSGYSGAGTTPSPKNDPEVLRDNLLPYALVDHMHEREVTRQLGRAVRFMPHVAPFFRGITLTIAAQLARPVSRDEIMARYHEVYANEPLVQVCDEAPLVRDNAGAHHVAVGGVTIAPEGDRLVVVATLDNLLKGAATQALQNMNLAAGFDELVGIPR